MTRVLLADPDPIFVRSLQVALEKRGLSVETVYDGYITLTNIQLGAADVCALDANLRGMESLTVLRKARAAGAAMSVIAVVNGATAADRLTWFNAGADDVIGKPFDPDELAVRLKTVHRRHRQGPEQLGCGPLALDVLSGTFLLGGRMLKFTPREHAFLKVLIARPGFIVQKERLLRAIFGSDAGAGAIDVLACRLRRKLAGSGVNLTTVRGMGYLLEEDRVMHEPAPA